MLLAKIRGMSTVNKGDKIRVHYTGRLRDGSVFDSSEGRDPLEFEVGAGHVIEGFDAGVISMSPGEKKQVEIPAAEAYGERSDELEFKVPREQLPAELEIEVGTPLQVQQPDDSTFMVTIKAVEGDEVTLDANHELAGQDLIFDIEIVSID